MTYRTRHTCFYFLYGLYWERAFFVYEKRVPVPSYFLGLFDISNKEWFWLIHGLFYLLNPIFWELCRIPLIQRSHVSVTFLVRMAFYWEGDFEGLQSLLCMNNIMHVLKGTEIIILPPAGVTKYLERSHFLCEIILYEVVEQRYHHITASTVQITAWGCFGRKFPLGKCSRIVQKRKSAC